MEIEKEEQIGCPYWLKQDKNCLTEGCITLYEDCKIYKEMDKKNKKDRWKAIINPILGFTPIKNMKMK